MKKFIDINDLFKEFKKRGVTSWIDKLGFLNIFMMWVLIILFFGFFYFFFTNQNSFLVYNGGQIVENIRDSIYFSFVTATTTGFGDIIPNGYFKLIAISEVIFGLLILAIVTSKLVSIKQDVILDELYELSLNERINRLRSSLILLRNNLNRLINNIEEKTFRKREMGDLYLYLSSLEDTLNEILSLSQRKKKNSFIKDMDPVDSELLMNSILISFEKLNELLFVMDNSKLEWRKDIILKIIKNSVDIEDKVFIKLSSTKNISSSSLSDLNKRKNEMKNILIELIESPTPIDKKQQRLNEKY